MLRSRLDLHNKLTQYAPKVYYQPPDNFQIQYPCIIYSSSKIETKKASNINYNAHRKYTVTYITREPDSRVPEQILSIPRCSNDRTFVTENLYHSVFTIYL